MTSRPGTTELTITAEELRALQESGAPLSILDIRWRQDRPEGLPEYLAGHIPGAVFVDLDYELTSPGRPPEEGNHPLPDPAAFQETVRRWGITAQDTVVVYDDLKNLSAARAWWLLRYAGLQDVRILDGSLRAWTGAGYALDEEMALPEPTDLVTSSGELRTASIEEIAALDASEVLIDARPADRYAGLNDSLSPRPGHIPGALSAPATGNVDSTGRLLSAQQLRQRYAALGVEPEITVYCYCFSGMHSAHTVLALTAAGFDAVLYPGGFGQWSQDESLRVETIQT